MNLTPSRAAAQDGASKTADQPPTTAFRAQCQASNGTVVQNLDASWKQVKVIAAEVGVPSDVIDTFPVNAVEDYL